MLTLLVLFCILLVSAFIVAVIYGVVAVAPVLLLIIVLPVIDYFVIKNIFRKKK